MQNDYKLTFWTKIEIKTQCIKPCIVLFLHDKSTKARQMTITIYSNGETFLNTNYDGYTTKTLTELHNLLNEAEQVWCQIFNITFPHRVQS